MYKEIVGVIPPMITPFKPNGEVDYDKNIANIKKWNNLPLAGYLVLGSNSETVFLTEKEKLKLIQDTVSVRSADKIILAGTGMESTQETIELTNKAASLGVDYALIVTPFYYGGKMNDEALVAYYSEVADNVNIPVLIYNVTKFTHVNISKNAVKILSKHENIIGMKDSSGSIPQLVEFKRAIQGQQFNLMIGTASIWYPALTLGVKAGVMALANCMPQECIEIQHLFNEGKLNEARDLYERVYPVNDAVTSKYGIAGLKYVCDQFGYLGGNVRKPLMPLKQSEINEIDDMIKSY